MKILWYTFKIIQQFYRKGKINMKKVCNLNSSFESHKYSLFVNDKMMVTGTCNNCGFVYEFNNEVPDWLLKK
jgi:hypothetical protein